MIDEGRKLNSIDFFYARLREEAPKYVWTIDGKHIRAFDKDNPVGDCLCPLQVAAAGGGRMSFVRAGESLQLPHHVWMMIAASSDYDNREYLHNVSEAVRTVILEIVGLR